MTRANLEANYIKLLEYEILRQLREYFGEEIPVTYDWKTSPLSDKPEIQVYLGRAAVSFKIDIYAGVVYIRGLDKGFQPTNSCLEVREI